MDAKEYISKAVKLFVELDSINEQLKELKGDAKASELDVPVLTAVAKAMASSKLDELNSKSHAMIEAIEVARS